MYFDGTLYEGAQLGCLGFRESIGKNGCGGVSVTDK